MHRLLFMHASPFNNLNLDISPYGVLLSTRPYHRHQLIIFAGVPYHVPERALILYQLGWRADPSDVLVSHLRGER